MGKRHAVSNPVQSISQCRCGMIRVDLGHVALKYDKEAFLAMVESLQRAARMLEPVTRPMPHNVVSIADAMPGTIS